MKKEKRNIAKLCEDCKHTCKFYSALGQKLYSCKKREVNEKN